MVRTQIQLKESQVNALKELATKHRISMAELIRRSVDHLIKNTSLVNTEDLQKNAVSVIGKFHSGKNDISINHDKYLNEDFNS